MKGGAMSQLTIFFLMIVAPALALCLALLGLETLRTNLLGWFLLTEQFGEEYQAYARRSKKLIPRIW